jgi:hypothetical protein
VDFLMGLKAKFQNKHITLIMTTILPSLPRTIAALACLALSTQATAQKVFEVPFSSSADVKVFVVDHVSSADLKVYKVSFASSAGTNDGKWFFTEFASSADKKIHFVGFASSADVKIFYVNFASSAGWINTSKKSYFD